MVFLSGVGEGVQLFSDPWLAELEILMAVLLKSAITAGQVDSQDGTGHSKNSQEIPSPGRRQRLEDEPWQALKSEMVEVRSAGQAPAHAKGAVLA